MEQKWSDRFNRLEALLLAKTLDQEPTFSAVKVTPTHLRPVLSVLSPFSDHQINLLHLHSHLTDRLPLLHRPPTQLLLPLFLRPVRILLSPHTDQGPLVLTSQLRDLLLWLLTLLKRTPRPVIQTLRVSVQIDLRLICTRKRVNYLTIMTWPLLTPTNPSRRNSHIQKQ